MRKKTIGEVLKLARTNQGLSLPELSDKTDIQEELLEALENNDYDRLPSPFYARSFLRKYAWAVDLDESIILEAYEAGEMIVYDEVELAEGEAFRSRKNKRRSSFLPLFYFVLLALAILAFVVGSVWYYSRGSDTGLNSSASYSLISEIDSSFSSASSSAVSSSSGSSAESSSGGKLETAGGGDQLTATFNGAEGPVELTLSATNTSSWVSVTGTELAEGATLSPDQPSRTVSLLPNTTSTITLGVVSGVSITVGGQPLDTSSLSSNSAAITLTIKK